MKLAIVAAVDEAGVIGRDGEMPWHYPADLRHFKETTTGHPVILGRRTYESIADRLGGPLPDRTNVVLSRSDPDVVRTEDDHEAESVIVAESVDEAVAVAERTGADVAYVAGGATVYEQCLPRADRLILTEIPGTHEGDTYFPEWDREHWHEVDREESGDLAFVTYELR